MAKNKKNSDKGIEGDFEKIFKSIKKNEFESQEDLEKFLNGMVGKTVEEITPYSMDPKEKAIDLVYTAYESTISKAKKLIKEALKLDPKCVEAYVYLGSEAEGYEEALDYYEKALKLAKKELGAKTFREDKGYFWGLVETRPYMRAKAGAAECLLMIGEVEKAIDHYEEMLVLNPGDNQGVRYILSSILLEVEDLKGYEKLYKMFPEDIASAWKYDQAMYLFLKEGASKKANKALLEAYSANSHVANYIFGQKKMPKLLPSSYGFGSEEEAILYAKDSWSVWGNNEEAFDWFYKFWNKQIAMN